MFHRTARVAEHVKLADRTHRVRLECPEIAAAIRPGQFVMVRLPGSTDPLLGRPFALYDTVLDASGEPAGLDIVYLVVGKLTGLLKEVRAGESVTVWGPLGNGFPDLPPSPLPSPPGEEGKKRGDHIGLVAGGIGQTPFLAHVRDLLGERGYGGRPPRRTAQRVSLFYGVRTADLAAGVEDFRAAGAAVHLASDDGSIGFAGFVTQLLEQHLPRPQHLLGCGPEPMMRALAMLARAWGVPCHLSLETPMACGLGVCFSCVTKVCTADGWDYRRVCVDGPVFDAGELAWE